MLTAVSVRVERPVHHTAQRPLSVFSGAKGTHSAAVQHAVA